jgi:hypothetical protein
MIVVEARAQHAAVAIELEQGRAAPLEQTCKSLAFGLYQATRDANAGALTSILISGAAQAAPDETLLGKAEGCAYPPCSGQARMAAMSVTHASRCVVQIWRAGAGRLPGSSKVPRKISA